MLCTLSGINANKNSTIMYNTVANSDAINIDVININTINQVINNSNFDENQMMNLPELMQQVNGTFPQPSIELIKPIVSIEFIDSKYKADYNEFIEDCNDILKRIENGICNVLRLDIILIEIANIVADYFLKRRLL